MQQMVDASQTQVPLKDGWGAPPPAPAKAKTTFRGRQTESTPRVLVVSPFREDRQFLHSVFETMHWMVCEVSTSHEVQDHLRRDRPGIVICEWDLPDGSWREILSLIEPLPDPPALLVATSIFEDSRWAEVLNLGAYDMLAKPFDRNEVIRVAGLAYMDGSPAHRHPTTTSTTM